MRSTDGIPVPPYVPGTVWRAARTMTGLTQAELGDEIGRDRRSICRLETKGGKFFLMHNNTTASLIARALAKRGVTVDGRARTIRW